MSVEHPLSFQLYSSREFPPLAEQLRTLKRLGYTNVEPFSGLYGDLDGLVAALEETGLSAVSGHFALDLLESDPARAVAVARRLGTEIVVAPYLLPEKRPADAAGWRELGQRLGAVARRLGEDGLAFAWHNHDFEFVALEDGSYPIEHILADEAVGLEVDVAWIVRAGADPLPWLERYAGRIVACHVKDIAPAGEAPDEDGWADVGTGTLDWPAYWAAAVAGGARLMIAEHDRPSDFLRFAGRSAEAIRRLDA